MQQERLLSMGETTAHFAHEIASPTQLIGMTTQQVREQMEQLKAEMLSLFEGQEDANSLTLAQHYQESFNRSLELLSEISMAQNRIKDLHEAVRNYFRQSISIEAFSLHDLIRECFVLARGRAQGLCLSFECSRNIILQSIRSQWMSVISNLIHNACDVINEQPEHAETSLHVFVSASIVRSRLALVVEDAGPGVPPELREKIFDNSFTTKKTGEGTGLGLALVRRIVEAQSGTIVVDESPKLGGARFLIDIPL
jgi:signal transduction histidine kinase